MSEHPRTYEDRIASREITLDELEHALTSKAAECDSLRAEVERLREDKARLDWLAGYFDSQLTCVQKFGVMLANPTGSFRDAIDAARAATEKQP